MPGPGAVRPSRVNWVHADKLALREVEVVSTAEELNKLAGNVVSAADLTKLSNVTATAAELNKLDGAGYGATGVQLVRVVKAQYDFAVHGGAVSTISLGVQLPANAIVLDGMMDVITSPAGVGASVAVQVEAANDIIAAAAITGAPWSTTGRKDIVPAGTAATSKKTTVARNVSVVISGADLTAGKFNVFLRYVESD